MIENNGVTNYVSARGTTSVAVTPENADENGIIWLKEESDGTSTWYGLDNSNGVFEEGSRFWVRWMNKNENPDEWEKYWAQVDSKYKNSIENDKAWIFQIGVTAPDGTKYTNFGQEVKFYVQIGEDWDREDIKAVFIDAGNDQVISATFVDNMVYPGGRGTFAELILTHFSPYLVYDELTDAERALLKTGDVFSCVLLSGLSMIMTLALAFNTIVNSPKKRKIWQGQGREKKKD